MSSPAEVPGDPIGTVVAAVTIVDPTLERDMVRRIVEQLGGTLTGEADDAGGMVFNVTLAVWTRGREI